MSDLREQLRNLPSGMTRKVNLLILILVFALFGSIRVIQVLIASRGQVDTMLVLGGTPFRERYAAQLALQYPSRKILISGGSEDPCIWLIFDKAGAPKDNVRMEHCSHNTFENFIYSTPILNQWDAHKVLLITDYPQATRAMPMAQIILGSKGMSVELGITPNSRSEESQHPLYVDIGISAMWALAGQVIPSNCHNVTTLQSVDMKYWFQRGFYCAPQADVDKYRQQLELLNNKVDSPK